MTPDNPSREYIADRIKVAREVFVGTQMFLYMLNREDFFQTMKGHLFPSSDTNLNLGRVGRDTPYSIANYGPLVESLRGNPQFNVNYMGLLLQSMVVQIGDMLSRNAYYEKTPELEFYRHLRNALGHGNRFHFSSGEPRRPATFQGREITAALQGTQAFFNFMAPGDVFELWENLERFLRQSPPTGAS